MRRAKERLTIPALWRMLGLPGQPRRSCRSPFREDRTASFSIYADGLRWQDFSTGEGGDAVDFLSRAKQLSPSEGARQFIALSGAEYGPHERNSLGKLVRTAPERDERAEKRQAWPELVPCTGRDLARIAGWRGLSVEGVAIAADRGLLWCAETREGRAWVLTDSRRRNAQARLLSGQPWAKGMKALTWPGSVAAWPIGLREAAAYPAIAWCEGGPDLLAACHLAWCAGVEARVAPVAMLGASQAIPNDALESGLLAGKLVRVFAHADPAGVKAGDRWLTQIRSAGARADGFRLSGLTRSDGAPVKDLNDYALLEVDAWERECAWCDEAFFFAATGAAPFSNQNQQTLAN